MASVRLIGHHAECNGQEEVAAALERAGVPPQHVEAIAVGLAMGLEERVVGEGACAAVAHVVEVQGTAVHTLPLLDLLLLRPTEELLHRVLEVERVVVAAEVGAAVLVVRGDVTVDGAFLGLDEVVVVVLLLILFIEFSLMLLFVLFIFFLVILCLLLVIEEESVVDLRQNIGLESVEILLGDRILGLLRVEGLGPGHVAQLRLPSNEV